MLARDSRHDASPGKSFVFAAGGTGEMRESLAARDTGQRLRVRRTVLALGGGAILSAVCLMLYGQGTLRVSVRGLALMLTVFWAVNLAFLWLIASGRNLRLADPSMTLAQMLWATVSTFVLVYFIDEARHLALMVYLFVMMFGAFRLNVAQYLAVTLSAVILYGLVIALLDHHYPQRFDPRAEFVNWIVFFAVMVGFSLLGSEISRLRDQLQRRNRELEEARDAASIANEAKSRFLATTSHELRTPLNLILGVTDILEGSAVGKAERSAITQARHAGEHLLSLVNSMIDLSMLESGTLKLRSSTMRLDAELASLRAMLEPLSEEREIGFVLRADPALPQLVVGDRMRLREVLTHLLSNAFKFTEHGTVTLRVETQAGRDNWIRFAVEDTGNGIPCDALDHAFEPFRPGDDSMTRRHAGPGLGLSICRKLVDQMQGEIEIESSSRAGSRISFAIPLPQPCDREGAATPPLAPKLSEASVLIVDDSVDNRLLLSAFLKSAVARVDQAENGAAGLGRFKRHGYDLVLMDMHMPVMDGLSAARAIRDYEHEHGLARAIILALTADDSVSDRDRSLAAGCDDHLVKPVSKKALIGVLQGRLGS